jgi:hypothetical protein
MTKTPGEYDPPKPITKAERYARKAFGQVDAKKAMTEHDLHRRRFLRTTSASKPNDLLGRPRGRRSRQRRPNRSKKSNSLDLQQTFPTEGAALSFPVWDKRSDLICTAELTRYSAGKSAD